MSLDVYLSRNLGKIQKTCDQCGVTSEVQDEERLFDANVTHNLTAMAGEAGIYEHCWHPENLGITKAKDLIEPLEKGIALMKADPKRFKAFNAPNGWGSYDRFVPWLEKYLQACKEYPDADVRTST